MPAKNSNKRRRRDEQSGSESEPPLPQPKGNKRQRRTRTTSEIEEESSWEGNVDEAGPRTTTQRRPRGRGKRTAQPVPASRSAPASQAIQPPVTTADLDSILGPLLPTFEDEWTAEDEANLLGKWESSLEKTAFEKIGSRYPGNRLVLWKTCFHLFRCSPFTVISPLRNLRYKSLDVANPNYDTSVLWPMDFCHKLAILLAHTFWEGDLNRLTMALQFVVICRTDDRRVWPMPPAESCPTLDALRKAMQDIPGPTVSEPVKDVLAHVYEPVEDRVDMTMSDLLLRIARDVKVRHQNTPPEQTYQGIIVYGVTSWDLVHLIEALDSVGDDPINGIASDDNFIDCMSQFKRRQRPRGLPTADELVEFHKRAWLQEQREIGRIATGSVDPLSSGSVDPLDSGSVDPLSSGNFGEGFGEGDGGDIGDIGDAANGGDHDMSDAVSLASGMSLASGVSNSATLCFSQEVAGSLLNDGDQNMANPPQTELTQQPSGDKARRSKEKTQDIKALQAQVDALTIEVRARDGMVTKKLASLETRLPTMVKEAVNSTVDARLKVYSQELKMQLDTFRSEAAAREAKRDAVSKARDAEIKTREAKRDAQAQARNDELMTKLDTLTASMQAAMLGRGTRPPQTRESSVVLGQNTPEPNPQQQAEPNPQKQAEGSSRPKIGRIIPPDRALQVATSYVIFGELTHGWEQDKEKLELLATPGYRIGCDLINLGDLSLHRAYADLEATRGLQD